MTDAKERDATPEEMHALGHPLRWRILRETLNEPLTNKQIAERLWISPGTVRRHLQNAFAKLGVHTRTAAVARLRNG
jgi:DNA-binding NarL/FixJ family response regulator